MQAEKYVRGEYAYDPIGARAVGGVKYLGLAVMAGIVLMLAGLRVIPEEGTPLMVKVLALMSGSIAAGAFGAYAGRNLSGWGAMIGLFLLTIIGIFVVQAMAATALGMPLLLGWGFVVGMSLGPLVALALDEAGHEIVMQSLLGTTGIMLLTGLYTIATGTDFRFIGRYYFIGLIVLMIVGIVSLFVRFSRGASIMYSLAGIALFSIGLLYKFSVLVRDENTWRAAVGHAMSLYLSFVNIFTFILQLLLNRRR